MAAVRNLGDLKDQNFRFRNGEEGQNALPCQISRRSVKLLLRYGNFSIFKDGGRRHLPFSKCGKFRDEKGPEVQRVKMRHRTKFRGDWLNRC